MQLRRSYALRNQVAATPRYCAGERPTQARAKPTTLTQQLSSG
jgi:hypothetical protein